MADIELIIKIPEEDFERCKKKFQMRINIMGDAIAKGTPIPNNATNRDVIEIMFPDGFSVKKSWWDALYRSR